MVQFSLSPLYLYRVNCVFPPPPNNYCIDQPTTLLILMSYLILRHTMPLFLCHPPHNTHPTSIPYPKKIPMHKKSIYIENSFPAISTTCYSQDESPTITEKLSAEGKVSTIPKIHLDTSGQSIFNRNR